MRITILNGNPDVTNTIFESYLSNLANLLQTQHEVKQLDLLDMEIKYCVGCFGCWVKKPGECLIKDDSQQVRRSAINSDLLVFASPVIMGFTSALLKRATDRIIPLVHPYMTIDQGEIHHRKRYKKYPRIALLLEKRSDTDDEDIQIIQATYQRIALNFKTRLTFTHLLTDPIQEASYAVNHL